MYSAMVQGYNLTYTCSVVVVDTLNSYCPSINCSLPYFLPSKFEEGMDSIDEQRKSTSYCKSVFEYRCYTHNWVQFSVLVLLGLYSYMSSAI